MRALVATSHELVPETFPEGAASQAAANVGHAALTDALVALTDSAGRLGHRPSGAGLGL